MAEDIKIAPDPDLIFVMEGGKGPQRRLHVSSEVMTKASKVFAAMLGPFFKEGRTKGTVEKPKIVSMSDDYQSMSDMCHVLHGVEVEKYLNAVSINEMFGLAVVVDKYACSKAMRASIRMILLTGLNHFRKLDLKREGELMITAYLFNDRVAFKESTRRMIGAHVDKYNDVLRRQPWSSYLPSNLPHALEMRRTAAQNKIAIDLLYVVDLDGDCNDEAAYAAHLTAAFGPRSYTWPPDFRRPVFSIFNCVEVITKLEDFPDDGRELISDYDFEDFAREVMDMCEGLCLGCVKENSPELFGECKNKEHNSI